MKFGFIIVAALSLVSGSLAGESPAKIPAPLILISMDGFRWDYCDLHPNETPNLNRIRREGISVRGLIPVFPSNTFPNHYSIVTGLYPAHHGIVNNRMFDPRTGEYFYYNTAKSSHEPQWWGGEPIWISAVKQGLVSACSYWPGSEVEIKGMRPTYWKPFDYFNTTFDGRLATLVNWLKRPERERPAVITFYMEETNAKGHDYGPDSPELVATIKEIDSQFGQLRARLVQEGITANFVVVSDHGMTTTSDERRLILDDFIDLKKVQIDDSGSVIGLRPRDGNVPALEQSLANMPHVKIYRAENLPERFHLRDNPRIPPIWILPEEGWRAETRAVSSIPRKSGTPLRGDHGYDPALPTMRGILIAQGPSFKSGGAQIEEVENIHVYNLLCAALGLTPAPNDGDNRLVRAMLKSPPATLGK